jgi:hypothetical protein
MGKPDKFLIPSKYNVRKLSRYDKGGMVLRQARPPNRLACPRRNLRTGTGRQSSKKTAIFIGQAYSEKEIMDMLAGAGLTEIKRIPLDSPNDSGLVSGIVP